MRLHYCEPKAKQSAAAAFWIAASRCAFLAMMVILVSGLTACGYKGRLKTPAQIEKEEVKKAHKKEREAAAQEKKETSPSLPAEESAPPDENTGGAGNEEPVTVPSKTEMNK